MSRYAWDLRKAEANLRKHGVSFDEAESVTEDPLAWIEEERTNPREARVRTIGWSNLNRLLVVITSNGGPRPRLISARRATKRERHDYERGR